MNSRERVLAAVSHGQPDRVPIDFGATRQSGIMAGAYARLKAHLGIEAGETYVFDLYQMLAEVEEPVRRRLHGDAVALRLRTVAFGLPNHGKKPWRLADGTPILVSGEFRPVSDGAGNLFILGKDGCRLAQMPPDGLYFESLIPGPGGLRVDPERYQVPEFPEEELRHLEDQAVFWRENSDYAIIAEVPQVELFYGFGHLGFSDWMVRLITEQEYVHELYAKAIEGMCRNFDRYHQAVGERVDIVKFNDDFGMQSGPFAHPELYRELVLPYYQRYIDHVKSRMPGVKIMQHCCGSIFPLIGMMIEAGVEILNPVQTSAENMDPHKLKETYGDRVCFWGGGVENQRVLAFGAPEQVAEQVEERLEIFGKGGGFVFNTIHNIQHGTPPENVVAAFDTAYELGGL